MTDWVEQKKPARVTCGWANVDIIKTPFVETAVYHVKHGDNLAACDAWTCMCGNDVDNSGFYPSLNEKYIICAQCQRVYTGDGDEVFDVDACNHQPVMSIGMEGGVECARCHAVWKRVM